MNIIRQGYFREMPHGDNSDPSICDFIERDDKDRIDKVCKYLESGIEIITCAGTVDDVIDPSKGVAGIPSVLTDGKWHWPGDLAYYVKNYNLELSQEFIDTMICNDWKNPITIEDIDFDKLSIDGEFLSRE